MLGKNSNMFYYGNCKEDYDAFVKEYFDYD